LGFTQAETRITATLLWNVQEYVARVAASAHESFLLFWILADFCFFDFANTGATPAAMARGPRPSTQIYVRLVQVLSIKDLI
jgi:hypothetical protein